MTPNYILNMSTYIAGKPIDEVAREFHLNPQDIVKLASNENPYGMSHKAKTAILNYINSPNISEIARYPDSNQFNLKQAISHKTGLPHDYITCGNGSNDLLELIARTLVDPKTDFIMYSRYSFIVYELAAQSMGAKSQVIDATSNYEHDLNKMLSSINDNTRLIFIANPNNPTGTFIKKEEILAFLQKIPKNIIVVLDEAYNEYLDIDNQYDAIEWLHFHNLIICRTFSKAYGLAALRIGYCLASPKLTDLLNRVRQPFNVNSIALEAAVAALDDQDFIDKTRTANRFGYSQISKGLDSLGISFIPSFGNFIMVNSANLSGMELNKKLLSKGIIIRPLDSYGLENYVRVSIGLEVENTKFLTAMAQIYDI